MSTISGEAVDLPSTCTSVTSNFQSTTLSSEETHFKRGCKLSDRLKQLGYGSSKLYVLKNLLRAGRIFVDGVQEFDGSRRVAHDAVFCVAQNEGEVHMGQHSSSSLGMQVHIIGPTLLVHNKPCGHLSALSDKKGTRHIAIPDELNIPGVHHVGRLDQHSTGLLLLTNDGHVTKKLIDPKSQIYREYVCIVCGKVDPEQLRQKLAEGVETRFGTFHGRLLEAAHFEGSYEHQQCCSNGCTLPHRQDGPPLDQESYEQQLEKQKAATTSSCAQDDSEDSYHSEDEVIMGEEGEGSVLSEVRLQVMEGKKREVRRMLAYSGHVVLNLRRESFGPIRLQDLKPGDFRKATPEELSWVMGLL